MDWMKLVEEVVKLIGSIAWPGVVVYLVYLFKEPLSKFIPRITEIGKGGIKAASGTSQVASTDEDKKTTELVRAFESEFKRKAEKLIYDDLNERGLKEKNPTTDILVQHLAAVQLQLRFESIHQVIWGSQISMLNFLNGQAEMAMKNDIKPFYQVATEKYPEAYKNYSYDEWLAYIESEGLVVVHVEDSTYQITELGREYLTYIAQAGKTGTRPY